MASDGATIKVQLAQRGVITLPKVLRETYRLKPGDEFTLLDVGGIFLLSPRRSEVDELAGRIATALSEGGETLESTLCMLREEREHYGRQENGRPSQKGTRLPRHQRALRRHLVGRRRRTHDPQTG